MSVNRRQLSKLASIIDFLYEDAMRSPVMKKQALKGVRTKHLTKAAITDLNIMDLKDRFELGMNLKNIKKQDILNGSEEFLRAISGFAYYSPEENARWNAKCYSHAAPDEWYIDEERAEYEGKIILLAREELLARGSVSGLDPKRNEDWISK